MLRKDSLFRRLVNKHELLDFLVSINFSFLYPEDYSFSEQISLFGNTKILIIESGAAMTNIMFCKPGTFVLEINPGDGGVGFWRSFAEANGLRLRTIVGTPSRYSSLGEFKVDFHEFKRNIQEIINEYYS